MKRQISLYLDIDLIQRHQLARTNISKVCGEFLQTFFDDEQPEEVADKEKEVQMLRVRLAKANSQLVVQKVRDTEQEKIKKKEVLASSIVKLRHLQREVLAGSFLAKDSYKALFDSTIIEFGLSREELAKKVF